MYQPNLALSAGTIALTCGNVQTIKLVLIVQRIGNHQLGHLSQRAEPPFPKHLPSVQAGTRDRGRQCPKLKNTAPRPRVVWHRASPGGWASVTGVIAGV
jgi:hypothetical protein